MLDRKSSHPQPEELYGFGEIASAMAAALILCAVSFGSIVIDTSSVGDATNDIPMFECVGLAVAMQGAMPAAKAAAQRVIGDCNTDAIGALVEELFLA